jgi:O-glycosyl hydrolase
MFPARAAALLVIAAWALPAQDSVRIAADPDRRFQTIAGFGVNFNGAYFREAQKPAIDLLVSGLGATLFRLDPFNISNWEVMNDDADPQHINHEYFDDRYSSPVFESSWAAARYLNSRGIRVLLTMSGTLPAWMLDMRAPGPGSKAPAKADHLRPDMYEEFAETAVSMALYARHKAHVDFEYFSPVNETDCPPIEGPAVSPAEFPAMLAAVSRRMSREGLGDVKLIAADQCSLSNDYFSPLLARPELMARIGAFSLHTYGKQSLLPQIQRVRASAHPHVPVWLTEYGDLNDRDFSFENEWNNFCLAATERALRALNDGVSAALFWDAYDNYQEHDLRITYYGLLQNRDHIYTAKKRYYAAKQLYRFVKPGAQRIAAVTDAGGPLVAAFRNTGDGSIVIVGLKRGGPGQLVISAPGVARWELYETTLEWNCARTDSHPAGPDGAARFTPAGESIFTLVGKAR